MHLSVLYCDKVHDQVTVIGIHVLTPSSAAANLLECLPRYADGT